MIQNTKGKRLAAYVPDYVVFDLETTGLSPLTDDIIEVSAIKVKNKKIIDTYSTLVNPERPIPYRATAVNGISNDMVADSPLIDKVLAEFLEFTENDVLVGHNIHTFDLKFVQHAANQLFEKDLDNNYIDTLYMARSCLPQLNHHKLVDISAHFGISVEGAHRAMNDCIMNQRCYEELGKLQENITIELCPKCGGELKKRSGKFGEFYGCGNFPNCRYTRNV